MCCVTVIVQCGKLIRFEVKLYCSVVLFIFLPSILCSANHNCPTQLSRVASDPSQTIKWSSKEIPNQIVLSEPPCMDYKGNVVVRTCFNRSWIPEKPPLCDIVIENNSNCPMLFKNITDSCVYKSQSHFWGTRCTLIKNFDGIITNQKYPLSTRDDFVWFPIQRRVKYGFYEWVTMDEKYGEPIEDSYNISYNDDALNKNCIVSNIHSKNIEPEYCDKSHIQVCPLYMDQEFDLCPSDCISAGTGTSKCYCRRQGRFCQDFAKIDTLFDKNILTALTFVDECYIDVSNTVANSQNYRQALYRGNWYYTNKTLNCSICSINTIDDIPDVEMILTFEKGKKKLFLQIYSPEGLAYNGTEKYVYCFTDASDGLKKRVKVQKTFEYAKKSDKEKTFYVYKVKLEQYIGNYWCEAHRKNILDRLVQSNKILAYKEKKGNEYSLRLNITNFCMYFNCMFNETALFGDIVHYIQYFFRLDAKVRVMEMFSFDYESIDILLHISTPRHKNAVKEFHKFNENFTYNTSIIRPQTNKQREPESFDDLQQYSDDIPVYIHIIYYRSSEFCMPEITQLENNNLSWPLASIDTSVVPEELCVQNNLPVFRVCTGDFLYGAEWSEIYGKCESETYLSPTVKYLHSAIKRNISEKLIENVTRVIENDTDLPVMGIHYLKTLFKAMYKVGLYSEESQLNNTLNLANSLLKLKPSNVAEAQLLLNTSDDILDVIDGILKHARIASQVYLNKKQNIALHITNPFISNVSGIIVYSSSNKEIEIHNFERNNTFDNISGHPDLLLAAYIPETILRNIHRKSFTDVHIITTVFFNDHLFVSSSTRLITPAVSIIIPGYGQYLLEPLQIMFKAHINHTSPVCGFWDYGKNTQRKRGQWSTTGGNYLGNINNSSIHSCSFSHLTHFALLILDEKIAARYLNNTDDSILTVITSIGATLTVIGVTGIFITAAIFEKWRSKQGTKILINLSISVLLEAVTMNLIEMKVFIKSNLSCQIIGSLMHYIVLSKFFWMLVYAFLQYMRFVKVLGSLPKNIVLKSTVFGWGFAIIPVVIVNILTPFTYSLGDHHFCYPKDISLYLGVIMPVVLIIFVNLIVFVIVMYQVSTTRIESRCGNNDSYTLQLKLATLLFFVLGIPWAFGVLANLITVNWLRTALVYLFCVTSTVQGFILFLFYVVFNKETRLYWSNYFCKRHFSTAITRITSSKSN